MMDAILALQTYLACLAPELGCDWQLLAGQAMQESGGDPSKIGDGGLAFGLWQIHQCTLDNVRDAEPEMARWALEDLLDPVKSLTVYMLEMLNLHFWLQRDYAIVDVQWVLVAWNWGRGNVRDALDAEIARANERGESANYTRAWNGLPAGVREYPEKCREYAEMLDREWRETSAKEGKKCD